VVRSGRLDASCPTALACEVTLKRTERVRQVVSGPMESRNLQQRTDEGWKLVAIEWEREVETADNPLLPEVPFGLRISPENQRLEQDPTEREILLQLMELMVQEGSYAHIADEINRRGFRTRQGTRWTQVSVFEMLPRLIEVGPQLFQSAEWQKRSQEIPREH
jgi:Recombinase